MKLCPTLLWPHGLQSIRLPSPWDFPVKNTGMGCPFLLQGISLTQVSDPCLLPWQVGSLPLSNLGSPNCLLKEKKKWYLPSLNNNRERKKELCLVYDIWKRESWSSKHYHAEINLHSRRPEQTDCNLQNDAVSSKITSRDSKDAYHYKISAVRSPHRLKINYCINIYYKSRYIDRSEMSSK